MVCQAFSMSVETGLSNLLYSSSETPRIHQPWETGQSVAVGLPWMPQSSRRAGVPAWAAGCQLQNSRQLCNEDVRAPRGAQPHPSQDQKLQVFSSTDLFKEFQGKGRERERLPAGSLLRWPPHWARAPPMWRQARLPLLLSQPL